jgi:hypothetical protein
MARRPRSSRPTSRGRLPNTASIRSSLLANMLGLGQPGWETRLRTP